MILLFADVTETDPWEPYLLLLMTTISISETAIENLVAFAGYTVTSQKKYTFYDTVSVTNSHPTAITDFCGEKLLYFQINGTNTTLLNANNSDYIYFDPPADTTDFGD